MNEDVLGYLTFLFNGIEYLPQCSSLDAISRISNVDGEESRGGGDVS